VNNFSKLPSLKTSLKDNSYTLKYSTETLIKDVFKSEEVSTNINELSKKNNELADFMTSKSYSMKSYYISNVVLIPVLTMIAVFGYFIKKEKFLLVTSILIYAFIIPAFIVLGLNIGYFLISIDYCTEINKYTTTDFFPTTGKGLGYYTSCVTKENQINLSTARYELTTSFNLVYSDVNKRVVETDPKNEKLPLDKRNNKLLEEFKSKNSANQDVVKGVELMINYNNILQIIEPTFTCDKVKDIVNFSERNFCYLNLTYKFEEMKFLFVGLFFLIPLAIGINRLIVVINPLFDKKKVSFIFII
jgi:hypothetical protein